MTMRRLCSLSSTPPRQPATTVTAAGLGAPAPRLAARHLPGRCATAPAWPRWSCKDAGNPPGGRTRRGDRRRGDRHRHRERRRPPAASRSTDPVDPAADRAGRDAAGRALATHARRRRCRRCSTTRRSPGGTRRSGRCGRSPRRRCAASARRWTGWGSPRSRRRRSSASATESGANVFAVDYFGRPAYLAQIAAVLQADRWSGCSSGSTRSGRCSGPSRTTPCGTSPSTSRSTSSSASSSDHRDVLAVLRRGRGRHGRRGRASAPAARRAAPALGCPRCRPRSRSLHFAEALALVGAPTRTSRTWRPSTSGRWASGRWREHGSDFVAVEGYPMAQAAVLHAPAARRTRGGRTRSTCCSAGWSWSPAGSGCTGTATTSRRSAARGEDPADVRGVPPGVPARDAAARRVRDRARALGGPAGRGGEHPRGHAVPARPHRA